MSDGVPRPIVRRIDHVGVAVLDIDAAITYYTNALGMRLSVDTSLSDGSTRLAYLEAADTTIQLIQPLLPGSLADFLEANGEGLHHICLSVTGELEIALHDVFGESPDGIYVGGRNCRVSFVGFRPNNVLIELTEDENRTSEDLPKRPSLDRISPRVSTNASSTSQAFASKTEAVLTPVDRPPDTP
jgi:methylmalonyl-CoA/ethylmalonyl-CoA epimerase